LAGKKGNVVLCSQKSWYSDKKGGGLKKEDCSFVRFLTFAIIEIKKTYQLYRCQRIVMLERELMQF